MKTFWINFTRKTYAIYAPLCDALRKFSIKKIIQFNFNFYIFLQSFFFTSSKFYNCTPCRHTAQASLSLWCQKVSSRLTQRRSRQTKKDFRLVRHYKKGRTSHRQRGWMPPTSEVRFLPLFIALPLSIPFTSADITPGPDLQYLRKRSPSINKSIAFWSPFISIDLHWSLLISIDLYWFLLISIDLYWSLLISIDPSWSLGVWAGLRAW